MRAFIFILSTICLLTSCYKGTEVDFVIHNAKVHVMDDQNTIEEAIAIKDGKIVEVGPERQIMNRYSAEEYIDAQLRDVYPGFTDAHGHIMSYAKQQLSANLVGSRSYDEMLVRIEKYQSKHQRPFIVGRGWDQSLWGKEELPNNKALNERFPTTPVCLFRIDGHALLANDALIQQAGIDSANLPACDGGYYVLDEEGNFTGVAVDNAMNSMLALIPDFPKEELSQVIMDIQSELYGYGITGVHEAGIEASERKLLEALIDEGKLGLNIYAMLLPSDENIAFARKHGIYTHENLLIRSFKVYGDGALGSRGAFLKQAYSDHDGHHGYAITPIEEMQRIADICETVDYQMNTHAIGDSANRILLELYQGIYDIKPDHRWRIEHAQIVDPEDFKLFAQAGVFPSVQPTHAVSDQRWAESRIGEHRMDGAYAYRSLLEQFGMLAIGTDFPVEDTDPFKTIHAAVNRKNPENFPAGGFLYNEHITLDQCIRGMTVWASYASFQENQLGTLEKHKDATLVIFDQPVQAGPAFKNNFSYITFINGKKVYSVE